MPTLTDIFAGAGGSSTGAIQVPGVEVRLAANHWKLAVDVHNSNHPNTEHALVDLHLEDPRNFPKTDILWASPECFAAGTLILTARGLVPIEDVRVGDHVLTHLGRYRAVTRVMAKTADTVRLVGQGLTRGLEVTSEHPILTTTGAGVQQWAAVSSIALDGRTRWATPTVFPASVVPPVGGPRPIHVEDPRFAWLVGRWLGDGSLRVRDGKSCETFVTCGKHEADDLERNLTWVHHDCGTCPPELTWSRRELRTAYVYANSHSEFARWLLEHFGQHAHGKTVPAWALGAPVEWRRALLDGYLSADGHDNGRGWQAASVSKRLALGIRLLAESLGHRVGLTYSHRDTWRIEGRTGHARPQWSVQWLHSIERETAQTAIQFGWHSWGTVRSIEEGTVQTRVYDLTVDQDHSYVADGIVVHNCTKWSVANSKAHALSIEMGGDPTLFDDVPDDLISYEQDEIDRSRLLMFDVLRFIEHHRYRMVIVENVVDIATQAKFARAWELWRKNLRRLGYQFRVISLNSMHAQMAGLPAPQSRDRLYIAAWPEGERAPDIERALSPRAWCARCGRVVESRQAWKNGRTVGRYKAQYVYVCRDCGALVEPGWLPASAAIDWSIQGQLIGERERPLSEKTMARIREGLRRYGHEFIVDRRGEYRVRDLGSPLSTITANETTKGLVLEAAGNTYDAADPRHPMHGQPGGYYRVWPDTDPLRTLHGTASKALLIPTEGREGKQARPDGLPLRTQTCRNELGILTMLRGTNAPKLTSEAMDTLAASGLHHGLLVPYYSASESAKPTSQPVGTLTTVDRYALVMRNNTGGAEMVTPAYEPLRTLTTAGHQSLLEPTTIDPNECTFRMLEPHEIAAGMSFPADYKWAGTKRDRVRMAGNAVTPPAARDLIACVADALGSAA